MTSGPELAARSAARVSTAFMMRSRTSSSAMPSSLVQSMTGRSRPKIFSTSSCRPGRVPLLGIGLFGDVAGDEFFHHLLAEFGDLVARHRPPT